jgi:hypothetical protein
MWYLPPLSEPFSPQKYFEKKNYLFVFDIILFEGKKKISVKFVAKKIQQQKKKNISKS